MCRAWLYASHYPVTGIKVSEHNVCIIAIQDIPVLRCGDSVLADVNCKAMPEVPVIGSDPSAWHVGKRKKNYEPNDDEDSAYSEAGENLLRDWSRIAREFHSAVQSVLNDKCCEQPLPLLIFPRRDC